MQITVMGTGYVGLVAGACFSDFGNDVICVDVNADKIAALRRGEIPIYEPGLADIVKRNVREGRLQFTTEAPTALRDAEVVFIAVGTPSSTDGSADLRFVCAVAEAIGDAVERDGVVIVCKSTVPIGTNARVRELVHERARVGFHVVSNPEFLKEGAAIEDFMKPDRIVIGSESPAAARVMDELYAPLVRTGAPILHMDVLSAELTKYAANAMLATRISFMNEVANLCSVVGADVAQVRRGIGTDRRIGKSFLFPGVGYGGSCFPKDVRALLRTAREAGVPLRVAAAVEQVNAAQKQVMVQQVRSCFGEDLTGRTFAVWGLAFKAGTDDMREAPSIVVIEALLKAGATVRAFDPQAQQTAREVFGDRITYDSSAYEAVQGACALLVITDWHEFRLPKFGRLKTLMTDEPVLFDGRNLYEPARVRKHGFSYYGIGRGLNPS